MGHSFSLQIDQSLTESLLRANLPWHGPIINICAVSRSRIVANEEQTSCWRQRQRRQQGISGTAPSHAVPPSSGNMLTIFFCPPSWTPSSGRFDSLNQSRSWWCVDFCCCIYCRRHSCHPCLHFLIRSLLSLPRNYMHRLHVCVTDSASSRCYHSQHDHIAGTRRSPTGMIRRPVQHIICARAHAPS